MPGATEAWTPCEVAETRLLRLVAGLYHAIGTASGVSPRRCSRGLMSWQASAWYSYLRERKQRNVYHKEFMATGPKRGTDQQHDMVDIIAQNR